MKFIKDILLLVVLLIVVTLAAFIPYNLNNTSINADHRALIADQQVIHTNRHIIILQRKNEVYACKLNSIFRLFVTTAVNTRTLLSNQSSFSPRVRQINLHAAIAYKEVKQRLKTLPPSHCKDLIGGS